MKFMRKNGGFTLVELIVVIAILAILAGVAVPAYSGYINKANEAADNQLLAAVNTAFAAACIENGVAPDSVTAANIAVDNRKIGAVSRVSASTGNPAGVPASFATYFTNANPGATFKVFNGLEFDRGTHNFRPTGVMQITYGGVTISIPQHYVDKLINSTFKDIGAESLLGQVADVSNLALQSIMGNSEGVLGQIVLNPDYANNLAQSLGMADATELENYLADKPNGGLDFLANSLVLSTAQNTANMTAEEATNRLNDANFLKTMTGKLDSTETAQDGLSDAALAYGLYTSYMHKNGQTVAKVEGMEDLKGALEVMKTDEFKTYLNSTEGQADVDAYLSAMKAIDSTTDSPDALKDALNNGFNNEDMLGAFGSLLGGNG